jgi:hypothetical protein
MIRYLLSGIFIFCIFNILTAQEYPAVLDEHYISFSEKDGVGSDYTTFSYYIKNTSEYKILYFNFRLRNEVSKLEYLRPLPEDIFVLDPHRTAKVCQVKVYDEMPEFSWNAYFLDPSVGFNKFPEQEKNYVLYWSADQEDNIITIEYYIKSLSDRRIKFHDFNIENPGNVEILEDYTQSFLYLEPEGKIKLMACRSNVNSQTPNITWRSDFTTFQPTNDEFCNQFIKIMEAAGEGEFGSVRGKPVNENEYLCDVQVPGIDQAKIIKREGKWWCTGLIGIPSDKKTVEKRLKDYIEILDNCLPDILQLEEGKDKKTKNRYAVFAGYMDDKLHGVTLKVEGSGDGPEDAVLKFIVLGAE